jgi:hypothetical protein
MEDDFVILTEKEKIFVLEIFQNFSLLNLNIKKILYLHNELIFIF